MKTSKDWKDYELIDTSLGYKYERWGSIYLLRPDPVILWDKGDLEKKYNRQIDGIYYRSNTGGGHWESNNRIPDKWTIKYKDLVFSIGEMGFKHTGLFPEQAYNWDYIREKIDGKNARVLNLFAYTGGVSLACLKAGASVCHVDSSKGSISIAKENARLSNLEDAPIRYIVDDVVKFVKREIRRGNKYDVIIMDPPSYGRGANGEVWSIEKDLNNLVKLCSELLSDKASLFLINSYSGLSKTILDNIVKTNICNKFGGSIVSDEIGLEDKDGYFLSCGIFCRWERD